MIASSSISFSLESFLTYLLTTHYKNLTIKLSPLENSLSKLASFNYIMLIWLNYSRILRQFELMLFLAKSFSVIRRTMYGMLLEVTSFERGIELYMETRKDMQLLYSRIFRSMFSRFSLLSSKVEPMCSYINRAFLKFCSKFSAIVMVRYLIMVGLNPLKTEECLKKAIKSSLISKWVLFDDPTTAKLSLINTS